MGSGTDYLAFLRDADRDRSAHLVVKDWDLLAEQPAPAPHLAHPERCAALRIVLVTVPLVSRSHGRFCDYRFGSQVSDFVC